ncbi:tRNA threonylcarbamoyladenosine dehydratase [Acidithiobacillus sp.]|uniref:tRNA threonylcarbamoyladenosine dehydratase n=1 Tax=Acidithiobacillus sp. TaxID=1872118 RepID=UPI0025BFB7F4|nr:tRNA threonylcarbamoyladenosine dehydratase [Acidithiobacillus sp.]
MESPFSRTEILLGSEALDYLGQCHVVVAGLGGVGGYVAENLARAGVGRLTLIDHDRVGVSNLNRQLVALHSTIGRMKVAVMRERIADIAPNCRVDVREVFLDGRNVYPLLAEIGADILADCIDAIACKVELILAAQSLGLSVFSSMGAGNRLDPAQIRLARLNQTEGCPLAREVRALLRKAGGSLDLWTVYSRETPRPTAPAEAPTAGPGGRGKTINGTISYMPAFFGLWLSSAILQHALRSGGFS